MTPKTEAKRIYEKCNEVSIMCNTRGIDDDDAIKFALIIVDEKIKVIEKWGNVEGYINFFKEVKLEINKIQPQE